MGIGALIGGLVTSAFAGVTFTSVLTKIVIGLAISLISGALTPKPKKPTFAIGQVADGRQQMVREAVTPRRTIYGQVQVSGPVTYVESYDDVTANKNEIISLIVTLAAHECDDFVSFKFGDTDVTFSYASPDDGKVIEAEFTKGGAPHAWLYQHLGTAAQTADTHLVADSGGGSPAIWTTAHRGRGIAYVHVRLKWDSDIYPDGVPKVRVVVKGKKVFDPRPSPTITAWSENPALILRDYLTSALGIATTAIDDNSVSTAANVCDEPVDLATSPTTTEKRYTCNGTVDSNMAPDDVIRGILDSMAGTLVFTGGVFKIYAGAATTASLSLDENDLRGAITVRPRAGRRDLFNAVKPVYVDPARDYQPIPATMVTNATYESQDGSERIVKTIEYGYTISEATAQRLGKIELERHRQAMTVTLPCNLMALQAEVWDVVDVTNPTLGWVAKEFRVTGVQINPDLGVDLVLREEDSTAWSWSAEETIADTAPNTNLPTWQSVDAPDNVVITVSSAQLTIQPDGTSIGSIKLTWDDPPQGFWDGFEVQWKRNADVNYQSSKIDRDANEHEISGIELGVAYDVRIRSFSLIGVRSDWVTNSNQTVAADTTAPALPTGVSITGGIQSVKIAWTNPSDTDFSHVEVYLRTSNSTPTTAHIVHSGGNAAGELDSVTIGGLIGGTTYYVWLKSVDYTANKSAFTTVQSAAATYVQTADIAADAITATLIADNSIQTPMLQANIVTAAKMAALTITASEINTNAITTVKINGLAVSEGKIAANAVSNSASAYTDGSYAFPSSYGTIQSATVTVSATTAVWIFFHGFIPDLSSCFSSTFQIRMSRDSTVIWSAVTATVPAGGTKPGEGFGMGCRQSIGAGTYTFKAEGQGTIASMTRRSIVVLQVKK